MEGWVGALAGILVGLLLSLLFWPLFLIGLIGAVIILFATRTAERSIPEQDDVMIAPCDGMVVEISGAVPPDELRLEGEGWTRIRMAASPFSSNGIYAPIAGAVDHVIRESGDQAALFASKVDAPGLAALFVSFEGGEQKTGIRIATGGFGPRLELQSEPGDAVRLGRTIGTRRLGGWSDIYVPVKSKLQVWPGQTVIGGETILAHFTYQAAVSIQSDTAAEGEKTPSEAEPEQESAVIDEGDEISLSELDSSVEDDKLLKAETATDIPIEEEDDVSEMFERLRQEAQKVKDD